MISGKQLVQVMKHAFTENPEYIEPSGNLSASISSYPTSDVPQFGIDITGNLVPNDAINISWVLKNSVGNSVLSATSNAFIYSLPSLPTAEGVYTYTWVVNYELAGSSTSYTVNFYTNITVYTEALYGQLEGPTDNIVTSADIQTASIGMNSITKNQMINNFPIVATNVGRLVMIVPDSFGQVMNIKDDSNNTVLNLFNQIPDPIGARTAFVSVNPVTPATYVFKLEF